MAALILGTMLLAGCQSGEQAGNDAMVMQKSVDLLVVDDEGASSIQGVQLATALNTISTGELSQVEVGWVEAGKLNSGASKP